MASAILGGAIEAGVVDRSRLVVADPNADRRSIAPRGAASPAEAWDPFAGLETTPGEGRILLAVKPQVLPEVAGGLRDRFAPDASRLVVSILAGVTADGVRTALGPGARVVRVMPNTPAQVGRGVSAVAGHGSATEGDLAWTRRLFDSVGEVVDLPEDLIDAFTGVAGSGPAYVFLLVEALAEAGESVGLEPEVAARVARAMVSGAGALLDADPRPAGELRAAVTSKGGTTAAALAQFESGDLKGVVRRAVTAARDRGRELGQT